MLGAIAGAVSREGVRLKGAEAVTPGADKDPEAWRNANDFVYTRVADGVLRSPKGGYWATWGAAVAMDPGGPNYQAFLLDQARRHVEKLPASAESPNHVTDTAFSCSTPRIGLRK